MGKEKINCEEVLCPVGRFLSDLESGFGGKSKFFGHINNSRIEFLKAIRSLVDEKIESFEKKGSTRKGKKSTKIKVE
ncbi:hypothetical protein ACFL0H_15875 [Thermodesulfobacteriota bacterium]